MCDDERIRFFVFINSGYSDVHKVRASLEKIEEIQIIHCPLGPTDLICYAIANNIGHMREIVETKIHPLMDDPHNGILHTETMLSIDRCGIELTREQHHNPSGVAAWVLADVNVSNPEVIDAFLRKNKNIVAVHNVTGRYDTIMYVEAENTGVLIKTIDDGIRNIRTFARGGTDRVLSRTDTRLVLMNKA